MNAPAIRYFGSKFRLAPWVISLFPAHRCYVEPFGGAAGVLLQKPRAYAEVLNDLDDEVVGFFRILRNPQKRLELERQLRLTPYARAEFEAAYLPTTDEIERARRLVIRAQMGFGSAGATKGTTGFRSDTHRPYGTSQHNWVAYPDRLDAIGERLRGVMIENRPALDVIQQHDTPDTLFFVDPPYVHSTRQMRSGTGDYRHEMTDDDHRELLAALLELDGFVVVTGYENPIYADALKHWHREQITARASAYRGTALRQEIAWMNPACADALHSRRMPLFANQSIPSVEAIAA